MVPIQGWYNKKSLGYQNVNEDGSLNGGLDLKSDNDENDSAANNSIINELYFECDLTATSTIRIFV